MKKFVVAFMMTVSAVVGCMGASADGINPLTGQAPMSPWPFILGGIALVLLVVVIVLSFINKKNNK